MSLTVASEQTARSLAQAERDAGRSVTIRRLDDAEAHPRSTEVATSPAESLPEPEPEQEPIRPAAQFATPEPISGPESPSAPQPAPVVEPAPTVEPAQVTEPVQAAEPAAVPEPASVASPREPARVPASARRRRLPLYVLAAAVIVVAAALADHWGVLPRLGASTSSGPTHVSRPHRPQRLLPPLEQPPVVHFGSAVRTTRSPTSAQRPQAATAESFARQAVNHCSGRITLMRTRAAATRGAAVPAGAKCTRTSR